MMGGINLNDATWNNLLSDCDKNNDGMVIFIFKKNKKYLIY